MRQNEYIKVVRFNDSGHYRDIEPYVTKDGSEIRELMHPAVHGNEKQSLAEANRRASAAAQQISIST